MHFPPFRHLPEDIVRYNLDVLREALPIPVPDTPQNRSTMDDYARGMFALLDPRDAHAASLAISVILFSVNASHALSFAAEPGLDDALRPKFRRQARQMAKLSRDLLRDLHEHQFARAEAAARQPLAAAPTPIPADPPPRPPRKAVPDLRLIETRRTVH